MPARDQCPMSCSTATEFQLPRRQLLLGLVALPALAASAAVAADQSALAVVDQASVVKTWMLPNSPSSSTAKSCPVS